MKSGKKLNAKNYSLSWWKSLNAFSFTSAKVLFSLIIGITCFIFRFLIKKCTTLLTMYFKYKTALQPYSLTILITYFALIRLPTGTTKYVRMCQLEECVVQSSLNFAYLKCQLVELRLILLIFYQLAGISKLRLLWKILGCSIVWLILPNIHTKLKPSKPFNDRRELTCLIGPFYFELR